MIVGAVPMRFQFVVYFHEPLVEGEHSLNVPLTHTAAGRDTSKVFDGLGHSSHVGPDLLECVLTHSVLTAHNQFCQTGHLDNIEKEN